MAKGRKQSIYPKPKMYQDTVGCNFDPNSIPESAAESLLDLNALSPPPPPPPQQPQVLMPCLDTHHHNNTTTNSGFGVEENITLSIEELSYHHHHHQNHPSSMDIELQNELGFNVDNPYNNTSDHYNNINNSHLVSFEHPTNWDNNIHGVHDQMQQQFPDNTTATSTPYPQPTDLLNLFSLPRCSPSSLFQNPSITFTNPIPKTSNFPSSLGSLGDLPSAVDTPQGTASSVLYDPIFHLNLPPQPPSFRELLQSLPHGYTLPGSGNGSLFSSGGDEREGSGGGVLYDPDADGSLGRQFDSGVLEFSREMASNGRGRDVKGTKHFATERQRRQQLNGKYDILKTLVPNPTKNDRASILGDAIDYINELLRSVDELKLLVEKKRRGRERSKRQKTEHDGGSAGDDENCNVKPLGEHHDQSYSNGSLRSSWLQRKSKDTEVDVRIIDDEVTIKLVQRKKINLLLFVSRILDEMQLDLHHVAGGHIGNSYSFLFNTKMYEGSCLYASAIAGKLIEVLDIQYAAAVPPTSSY